MKIVKFFKFKYILLFQKSIFFFYFNIILKLKKTLKIFYNFKFNKIEQLKFDNNFWNQCKKCYKLTYTQISNLKYNICDHCKYHFQIQSRERFHLLLDQKTWNSFNDYLISKIKDTKKHPHNKQISTGLIEAVQTGIGILQNKKLTIGIMDFTFIGGSLGSVVGEKITCLFEYTIEHLIPIILICSSGGTRMQEGSISLMQMTKITAILSKFQKSKLLYITVLTSPTTGGVISSFGMLGDLIIVEPNSVITFTGKRVIEQTLKQRISETLQFSDSLFKNGLFDLIIPRNLLQKCLHDLLKLHNYN